MNKLFLIVILAVMRIESVHSESNNQDTPTPAIRMIEPYRSLITIQRINLEDPGDGSEISNVRIEGTLPGGETISLPQKGKYWQIGRGQVQEINYARQIPWEHVNRDGFKFTIQIIREGSDIMPCQFDVVTLSEFNRVYVCKTDERWQKDRNIPVEKIALQIRVSSDRNPTPIELAAKEPSKSE